MLSKLPKVRNVQVAKFPSSEPSRWRSVQVANRPGGESSEVVAKVQVANWQNSETSCCLSFRLQYHRAVSISRIIVCIRTPLGDGYRSDCSRFGDTNVRYAWPLTSPICRQSDVWYSADMYENGRPSDLSCWSTGFFISFFIFWGVTRSLRMPAPRPASHAGPVRNPWKGLV